MEKIENISLFLIAFMRFYYLKYSIVNVKWKFILDG